jgi:holo-[acyl-carrier protein] synthase
MSVSKYNFFKRRNIGKNEITPFGTIASQLLRAVQGTVIRLLSVALSLPKCVFARKNVSKQSKHRAPTIQTGIDIVPILRFQKLIDKNSFLTRNFTKNEINYCKNKHKSAVHFAGKFAAKEAVSKALKLEWKEGLNWKEIEIINEESGAPTAVLHKQTKSIFDKSIYTELQISISHCDEYAVAVAVVL